MKDIEILQQAHTLITRAIHEEELFGDGNGANFSVMDNARKMVEEYNQACANGTISNEPV
jgi:hypothetical protein